MSIKTETIMHYTCDSCQKEVEEQDVTELRPATGRKGDAVDICKECVKLPIQTVLDLFAAAK